MPEVSDYQLLFKGLYDRTGPIPDGKAQGAAAKWLIENGYSVEESLAYFDHLLTDPKRDHRISLLTVKSGIGTYRAKKKERQTPLKLVDLNAAFTRDDAIELLGYLEEEEGFEIQIRDIREWFSIYESARDGFIQPNSKGDTYNNYGQLNTKSSRVGSPQHTYNPKGD